LSNFEVSIKYYL